MNKSYSQIPVNFISDIFVNNNVEVTIVISAVQFDGLLHQEQPEAVDQSLYNPAYYVGVGLINPMMFLMLTQSSDSGDNQGLSDYMDEQVKQSN